MSFLDCFYYNSTILPLLYLSFDTFYHLWDDCDDNNDDDEDDNDDDEDDDDFTTLVVVVYMAMC